MPVSDPDDRVGRNRPRRLCKPQAQGGVGPERYDSLQGESGPVAWEVKNLRQTREEGGRQVTWWYDLILRNMGSVAIDF